MAGSSTAFAVGCATMNVPATLDPATTSSLNLVEAAFAEYSPTVNLLSKRNEQFSDFPRSDWKTIVESFFINYCNLVRQPRWGLSDDQIVAKLNMASEKLYTRVSFKALVYRTSNISLFQDEPRVRLASNNGAMRARPQYASLDAGYLLAQGPEPVEVPENKFNFILEAPFYVIKHINDNFLIVASPPTLEAAISEANHFKGMAPQLDFVVYEPYPGNPTGAFSVMMATWLSVEAMEEAKAMAKKHLGIKKPYVWACRRQGDSC